MRTRWPALLGVVVLLGACDRDPGTIEVDAVDAAAYEDAAEAEDLAAALDAGERLVDQLLVAVDVEPRSRDDVRPYRVSLCDETVDDGPRVVSVGRGIAFPSEDTDAVVARVRDQFEAAGVDGFRVVGEDGDVPMVTGVFADDRWQVSATLNRVDGIGEVRANSPCLPGDLPDPPSSSAEDAAAAADDEHGAGA